MCAFLLRALAELQDDKNKYCSVVGAAVINVLAFSDTNYVFSKLSDHGAAERKRHDLVIEQPSKDREKCNDTRLNPLDFIGQQLREKQELDNIYLI